MRKLRELAEQTNDSAAAMRMYGLRLPEKKVNRLSALAPELRNKIYALVVQNQEEVSVCSDGRFFLHPFLQTSQAIRKDFLEMWRGHVIENTPRIKVCLANFILNSPLTKSGEPIGILPDIVKFLPPPSTEFSRTIVLHVRLTRMFDNDKQLRAFLKIIPLLVRGNDTVEVEASWDPATFDKNFLKHLMTILRHHHLGPWITWDGRRICAGRVIHDAMAKALKGYEDAAEAEKERTKRRREKPLTARLEEYRAAKRQKRS